MQLNRREYVENEIVADSAGRSAGKMSLVQREVAKRLVGGKEGSKRIRFYRERSAALRYGKYSLS